MELLTLNTFKKQVLQSFVYRESVWDLYMTGAVKKVESVQQRAARYTLGNLQIQSPVCTCMQPLAERCGHVRLVMFYKIHHRLVSI